MRKGRFGCAHLNGDRGGRSEARPVSLTAARAGLICLVALGANFGLTLTPASASAEPLCTNSWTGPSEGEWGVGSDWSAARVPTSADVVCIGSGNTVRIVEGYANQAGVLQGEGTLALWGGSLEVSNNLEVSKLHALELGGGAMTGAATVDISGSLSWEAGAMSGGGSTVILPGATATLHNVDLEEARSLVNEGTATFASGSFSLSGAAKLRNLGTFEANSEGGFVDGGGAPLVINSGLFEKTAGSGPTEIDANFENQGTIKAETGPLRFAATAVVTLGSSVLEGTIENYGSMTGSGFNAQHATLILAGISSVGTLSVAGGSTATVGTLEMNYLGGSLTGAGTVDISGSLNDQYGFAQMSGSGSTVILPGATMIH